MIKNNKMSAGITLIALVVTIIVLLLLAGISIQTLLGNNSIFNRAGQASEWSEIAKVEELANLELIDNLIGVKIENEAQKGLAEILETLKTRGKVEDYGQTGLTTVTGITFGTDVETNGVTLEIGDANAIEKTATFTNSSQNYYVQIKRKKYPIGLQNGKITITKTAITLGTSTIGEITEISSSNENVATVAKVSGTTDRIKITGIAKGTATITVKYTEQITTTFTVTVKGNVSVTTQANVESTIGIATIMSSTTYAEGSQITLTTTVVDNNYRFDGWYETIDSGTENKKENSTTTNYNYTVPDNATSVSLIAKFVEKPVTIAPTTSGVGYYIKKGNEYAVVFADRLAQASRAQDITISWKSSDTSNCVFPQITGSENFKTYVISDEEYTDPRTIEDSTKGFGTKKIIKVADDNTGTEDRFMALSLTDISTDGDYNYYWYYSAGVSYPYMNDFNALGGTDGKGTPTSTAFLAGKRNTETMIAKWNAGANGGYGVGDSNSSHKDVWGQIQFSNEWFIPSKDEWSAFGYAMSQRLLTSRVVRYSNLGLGVTYWSSSQDSKSSAWSIDLYGERFNSCAVNNTRSVRLATTF